MENRIRDAFDAVQTPEAMKRAVKAHLRRRTFDYGRNGLQKRTFHRRLAGMLASLVLMLSCLGVWFLPAASIGVDINPSIEMKVNVLDRVIALEGHNSDGIALAAELDVTGMPYDQAMQRILLSNGLEPYLESGKTITITVAGGASAAHAQQMLSNVVCRAYAIAEEENVLYCQVGWETVKAARAAGLCIPRYLAWQELLKTDPTITAEDVRELPKEEIHQIVDMDSLENPCGERRKED